MTEPTHGASQARREIAAEHLELMRQIQRLALRSGQLMQRMYESGGDAASATQAITQINTVDRERELTEIKARAAGVPAEWIDRVRTLGQRGFDWSADQPLPDPAPQGRRRTVQRVAGDIERLKDMAAVHIAYERSRPRGELATDVETVVAQQFRRNMDALWMRAGRTAQSIGMDPAERTALWSVTAAEWRRRVEHYMDRPDLGDVHTRWRRYGDISIAAEARKSLGNLRRAGQHGPDIPLPEMPMTPARMLTEASAAIDTQSDPHSAGADPISAAVDAALPDGTAATWSPESAHPAAIDAPTRPPDLGSGSDP